MPDEGQKENEYQSYTMMIGRNAAGDAEFETFYNGIYRGDARMDHYAKILFL